MKRKAIIVVTNHGELGDTGKPTGWFLPEVSRVYGPLKDAGFQIDFVSPHGGFAPMDPSSDKDLEKDDHTTRFLKDREAVARTAKTLSPTQVEASDYDLIYFAGGHGTMWDFPDAPMLQRLAVAIYESGGIVASICHGAAALVNLRLSDGSYLVAGKEVSCFTDEEERAAGKHKVVPFLLESKLRERGARFHPGPVDSDTVVVHGRLVTGQNAPSALSLGLRLCELADKTKRRPVTVDAHVSHPMREPRDTHHAHVPGARENPDIRYTVQSPRGGGHTGVGTIGGTGAGGGGVGGRGH